VNAMRRAGTTVLTLILLSALVAGAWAVPVIPCSFWGNVTINGQPAAAGTTIAALIDGEVCGEMTTTEVGKYGAYAELGEKLAVKGSDGDAGKTIRFTVAGTSAGQTATFVAGNAQSLDLSVSTGSSGGGSSSGGDGGSSAPAQSGTLVSASAAASAVGTGALQTTSAGAVTASLAVTTQDRICTVTVTPGVVATGADGTPLQEVTVTALSGSDVPTVPSGAVYTFAGHAVRCGPAGATFDPAVTLSFTLSEEEWSQLSAVDLSIKWYDEEAGAWVDLPVEVDAATRTVTTRVSHFSVFALFSAEKEVTMPSQTVATPQTSVPAGATTAPAGDAGTFPWAIAGGLTVLIVVGAVYFWRNKKQQP